MPRKAPEPPKRTRKEPPEQTSPESAERTRKESAKRTRKDGRKTRTRQALIDATLDIVRSEDAGALTTGKIANRAGIQQPGFYAHFKNVDDCLRASAEQIASYMVDLETQTRRDLRARTGEPESLSDTIERTKTLLRLRMENARITELLVHCQHDSTALGQVSRDTLKRAARNLVEDLWDLAMGLGIRGRYLRDVETMAALLVRQTINALDMLLSGQFKDVDAVATALARAQYYHVRGEFRRMLLEQNDAAGTATPAGAPARRRSP